MGSRESYQKDWQSCHYKSVFFIPASSVGVKMNGPSFSGLQDEKTQARLQKSSMKWCRTGSYDLVPVIVIADADLLANGVFRRAPVFAHALGFLVGDGGVGNVDAEGLDAGALTRRGCTCGSRSAHSDQQIRKRIPPFMPNRRVSAPG